MSKLLFSSADSLATFQQQNLHIRICSPATGNPELRWQMEQCIARHFAAIYGARVNHFMPVLLGLESEGEIKAVVGLRPADFEPLFLQQYLDQPIHSLIAQTSGLMAARETVVEVGNLVSTSPGMARLLIIALTHFLHTCEYQWVAFTGTPTLLNSFSRLTLSPVALADADPARLTQNAHDWGSYYATNPKVMAGFIPEGFLQLQAARVFERLTYQPDYQPNYQPDYQASRLMEVISRECA